jgi:hypothetical protein
MIAAAGRLASLARAGAAGQARTDGGRTDEQKELAPLDRHPATLPAQRARSRPSRVLAMSDGTRLAVREAVDHQGDGEVEAVVAGSGGELGGVALGLREGIGQRGEPAE